MKMKFLFAAAILLSAFTVKAQDPAVAGINPQKSPLMVNETTIIEADILNGSSAPIRQNNNATWTINLPPNIEVTAVNFDDPSVSAFLSVTISPYDPVEGTTIFIVSDKGNFPGSAIGGAYIALISVKGVKETAVGVAAPMSINAATTPPVGTNNNGNDNASSSIVVSGVLPVTLISFDIKKEGQATQLYWATTAETNSDYFEIQHSITGKVWAPVGKVSSQGESSSLKNYTFSHSTPVNGENLYRLKMVDKDQTYAYSRIQSVKFEGLTDVDLSVYPNPVSDKLSIRDISGVAQINIYDLKGVSLYQSINPKTTEINVKDLRAGMYIVKIQRANGLSSSQKIVVSK